MADLKTITLPDNNTYNFRDSRVDELAGIKSVGTGLNLSSAGVLTATGGGTGGAAYSTELPMGSDATDYPAKQLADTAATEITYADPVSDAVNAVADLANENRGLLDAALISANQRVISSTTSVAARSNMADTTIAVTSRAGYTPVFVSPRNTGHGSLHFYRLYLSGNNIVFALGNPSASAASTSTAYVNVLYARTELV